MTNYFIKIAIWLHYWLLHLKNNQITNYFTFKLTFLKLYLYTLDSQYQQNAVLL